MRDGAAALLRKYGVPGPRYTSYPTVPFWESTPTESQWLEHVDTALRDRDGAGAALYVHIPFCHALCTFCGCNMRVTRNHALVMPYVNTVLREQRQLLQRLGRTSLTLGEVYLGGGTPTYLHAEELDALLDGLLAHVTVAPGASLTVEADPRITHLAQLEVLRRHGFDRISLGVQDFDPRVQEIVNRVQDEAQVRRITEEARTLGFRGVSYDLIYGLPLQTPDSLAFTMEAVTRLRPDRIAFYPYAHVPWIKPTQRRFTEADLPEGDARRGLQAQGRERMFAAGYVEIGMDLFALPADDLAVAAAGGRLHRNFMGYTAVAAQPLLGLGVSSISDAGQAFAQNEKNLQQYEDRVTRGELPIQRGHVLDAEDRILRRHILGLLTRYATDWEAAADHTPFLEGVAARLEEPRRDGLVVLGPRSVTVTAAGRPFLRNICMAFDARLARRLPDTLPPT
jgi:oxygen-independent coproporphyrinogen-3 oxidase